MRPAIKSGLLPVWRDRDTLQIGIDSRRAIALSGMSQAAVLVGLLDGSRDREQAIAAAASQGVPFEATERILSLLAAGGALDDFPASALREVAAPRRARLASELATASLAYGDSDGGARVLARRRAATVRIEGDRRIGQAVGRILTTSGVGQVRFSTAWGNRVTPARERSERHDGGSGACLPAPGLVILVGRAPADRAEQLARDKVPHLAAVAAEAIGVVGPLVVPGRTACLRCLDYIRAGNDQAWPLILAQIDSRRPEPQACDAFLAATVAAQTAGQALAAIDTAPIATATANGTLELVLPDWRWRRRTWSPQPACPCTGRAGR
jgi:hypothetical protein